MCHRWALIGVAAGCLFSTQSASSFVQDETPGPKLKSAAQSVLSQQEPVKKPHYADPPELKPLFSDEFSTDTRDNYEINKSQNGDAIASPESSPVTWEPGMLELHDSATISRKIAADEWVEIDVDLAFAELTEDGQKSELIVLLDLTPANDSFALLRQQRNEGAVESEIALCVSPTAILDAADLAQPHAVRSILFTRPLPNGHWRFVYRFGVWSVISPDDDCQVWGHIGNYRAEVRNLRITQYGSATRLRQLAVRQREKLAARISPEEKRQLRRAEDLSKESAALYRRAKFEAALPLAREALDIFQAILGTEHPDYAGALNNMAAIYDDMGDYENAKQFYLQAHAVQQRVLGNNHPSYAATLNNLALLYDSTGEYSRAKSLLLETKRIKEKVLGKNHPSYARCLNNLADNYRTLGEYAQAEPLFLEARRIWEQVHGKTHPDVAMSIHNLAYLYQLTGDYARAEALCLEARKLFETTVGKEHSNYAINLNNLASIYEMTGDYARAESILLEAQAIREKVVGKVHSSYAAGLNNLGSLYRSSGDITQAEAMFLKAKEVWQETVGKGHASYASCLINLADAYRSRGELLQAEILIAEANEILEQNFGKQHPEYATGLNHLAQVYEEMGEIRKEEALLLDAKSIRENLLGNEHLDVAQSLHNLAFLYQAMGDYVRAEALSRKAYDVLLAAAGKAMPTMSEAQASNWMAKNWPRVDVWFAALRQQQGFDGARAYQAVWGTKSMATRLRIAQWIPDDASPEAHEVFGQLRDARLRLAQMVSATPKPDQAAEYRSALAEANERKEALEKRLAEVNPGTKRAVKIRDARVDELVARLPAGVAVVDLVLMDDWEFVDQEITLTKEDGTTESRIVKREKAITVYDAFVLRSNQPEERRVVWVQLGEAGPIESAVAGWRHALTGETQESTAPSAPDDSQATTNAPSDPSFVLRQRIWEKLEPHLNDCHTVIILPDGALNRIPWGALPGRIPSTFLIEDYALATATYGQQLFGLLSDAPVSGDNGLLVAGGIRYDARGTADIQNVADDEIVVPTQVVGRSGEMLRWRFLSGADQEAKAIVKAWSVRAPVTYLHGSEANEPTVTDALGHARYAHLATHGFFDKANSIYYVNLREQNLFEMSLDGGKRGASVAARNPLLMTGIVLAGADLEPPKTELGIPIGNEDGILTAEEIIGLNLHNMELVTLSACETGLGDVAAGEGVMGLQRAFHQAGVRTTVTSLWKVDDIATQRIMTRFYMNLWEKKMAKLEALREAQIWMLTQPQATDGISFVYRGEDTIDPSKIKEKRAKDLETGTFRAPPYLWAAWVLSGDWR